ncbi:MAG: type II toxin-antitoxin system RelE/ParE family toxin [Deltaproteobacteria bacterium]|nr:type II toxin-antitoxin system RelE/ParE family toxin [Deltaproteobacteria bacterium]
MKHLLEVRERALEELTAAARWYDEQELGLGAAFLGEAEALMDRISAVPRQFPEKHRALRRALFRRFPYAVFFVARDARVIVVAVLHQASSPARLRGRGP